MANSWNMRVGIGIGQPIWRLVHYLSPATIGSVVPMDAVTHQEPVIRLCLVARPFTAIARPVPELVSTLCFKDLEPLNSQGPTVIFAHTMEVIDV